ncbi:MAG TPA: DUF4407 domain-containing protein [Pseudonocardia sp.]|uniref:DUF4407 domain-containing protein n=1 Tax=Pseudonocardia sp. TaxID=60912 RepID=UPI002CCFB855|nr:DUF4407 domain-containing protein [Pseudonocardia sp.]HTF46242.1 DUF4407 domain-containing protein [Pseudonocardia sp.]
MSSPVTPTPLARLANPLVWLGGGSWRDIDEPAERSAYQTAGFFVALHAVLAGCVVAFVAGLAGVGEPASWVFGVASGLLVGAVGRVLATAPAEPNRGRVRLVLGEVTQAVVAVLLGVVIGELAALAIFAGAVDRELNSRVDAAGATVAHSAPAAQLDTLQTDRAALDTQVQAASERRDRALVVARCEYRPGPGCPSTQITGDRGRGPETGLADAELNAAQSDLTEASTRRDRLGPGLDQAITGARGQLDRDAATARALAAADTGLDARWAAMHSYTTRTADSAGPLVLRIAVDALFALLSLLPLLLRWWRGQTSQDRRLLARARVGRAEQDAATTVAINRAQLSAALELDQHRRLLAEGTALGAAPERIEIPAASVPAEDPAEVPAAETVASRDAEPGDDPARTPAEPARLPVLARLREAALAPVQGDPLDVLPGPLPGAVRAITGIVRPLVPGPVARLASTAPRSVRVARTLWEEVEEFQLTVRHKRTVRMDTAESDSSPTPPSQSTAPGEVLDTDLPVSGTLTRRPTVAGGELADEPRPAVPGRRPAGKLTRGRRELPPAPDSPAED